MTIDSNIRNSLIQTGGTDQLSGSEGLENASGLSGRSENDFGHVGVLTRSNPPRVEPQQENPVPNEGIRDIALNISARSARPSRMNAMMNKAPASDIARLLDSKKLPEEFKLALKQCINELGRFMGDDKLNAPNATLKSLPEAKSVIAQLKDVLSQTQGSISPKDLQGLLRMVAAPALERATHAYNASLVASLNKGKLPSILKQEQLNAIANTLRQAYGVPKESSKIKLTDFSGFKDAMAKLGRLVDTQSSRITAESLSKLLTDVLESGCKKQFLEDVKETVKRGLPPESNPDLKKIQKDVLSTLQTDFDLQIDDPQVLILDDIPGFNADACKAELTKGPHTVASYGEKLAEYGRQCCIKDLIESNVEQMCKNFGDTPLNSQVFIDQCLRNADLLACKNKDEFELKFQAIRSELEIDMRNSIKLTQERYSAFQRGTEQLVKELAQATGLSEEAVRNLRKITKHDETLVNKINVKALHVDKTKSNKEIASEFDDAIRTFIDKKIASLKNIDTLGISDASRTAIIQDFVPQDAMVSDAQFFGKMQNVADATLQTISAQERTELIDQLLKGEAKAALKTLLTLTQQILDKATALYANEKDFGAEETNAIEVTSVRIGLLRLLGENHAALDDGKIETLQAELSSLQNDANTVEMQGRSTILNVALGTIRHNAA